MTCENIFCIYQKVGGECSLERISIDNAGMCEDCIQIDVDEKKLQGLKNKLLKKYEQYYKDYDYD
ncbi:MAG: hypothetical protein R3Y29_04040 [bacterium]